VRFTPDNVLIPDICFVAQDRQHVIGPKAVDAAPDLVVEAASPETRQRDMTIKRAVYARFGVREYWIVDPDIQIAVVLTLVGDRYEWVPQRSDRSIISLVLPDLDLTSEMVFDLRGVLA
jgi:Uma2 family endonuclease